MKTNCFVVLFLLAACNAYATDVPVVKDPHHPTDADGKPIKGVDFVRKYCAGKDLDETCLRVKQAVNIDSRGSTLPKGW